MNTNTVRFFDLQFHLFESNIKVNIDNLELFLLCSSAVIYFVSIGVFEAQFNLFFFRPSGLKNQVAAFFIG